MFTSRIAQLLGMVLLVCVASVTTRGDVLITYESDVDRDPSTPDVIDLNLGESSTITISLIPIGAENPFNEGGFVFAGEMLRCAQHDELGFGAYARFSIVDSIL